MVSTAHDEKVTAARLNVPMSRSLYDAVEDRAVALRISRAEYARRAIREYVESSEPKQGLRTGRRAK